MTKKVCVITSLSLAGSGVPILTSFIEILRLACTQLFVITSKHFADKSLSKDGVFILGIKGSRRSSAVGKIISYGFAQLRVSLQLVKISRNVDTVLFFVGANTFILPMIVARVLRKRTLLVATGAVDKITKMAPKAFPFSLLIVKNLMVISYLIANNIIVYTPSLIEQFGLNRYKSKILVAERHFVNPSYFKVMKRFDTRGNIVGYIGHVSIVKGAMSFAKAIPLLVRKNDDLKFLIVGDGESLTDVREYLSSEDCLQKVKITGWTPYSEIPKLMNDLKLLVIPSYTESGPSTDLEAMSCGTPILATKVGHVPDIIIDGENGFIMENNSPECIAENVMRILSYHGLDNVVDNARRLIEKEYTCEVAAKRYRTII
ncbi:glycosyltransferase family 4 protein [Chloroflexota bacterium]